jgi:hypothetical protein
MDWMPRDAVVLRTAVPRVTSPFKWVCLVILRLAVEFLQSYRLQRVSWSHLLHPAFAHCASFGAAIHHGFTCQTATAQEIPPSLAAAAPPNRCSSYVLLGILSTRSPAEPPNLAAPDNEVERNEAHQSRCLLNVGFRP